MISTTWKKIGRDLIENKGRTLIVILAISVGVISFGSMFISQDLLLSEMATQYQAIKPSTMTIGGGPFDENTVKWLKTQPEIVEAQGKTVNSIKIIKDGKTYNADLNTYKNFASLPINQIVSESGNWPPKRDELVLERTTASLLKVKKGDIMTIELSDGKQKTLTFGGTVHDYNAIPANLYPQLTGYVSEETLVDLGDSTNMSQVEVKTNDNFKTQKQLEDLAAALKNRLEGRGLTVSNTVVREPNKHWAEDNSKAFTAILSVVGTFSLILSGFLVINTISAILTQQKRQIGVLKLVGASDGQVTRMYLLTVAAYGLLGLVVAVPLAMALGYVFLKAIDVFLNLDILNYHLPLKIFLMEAAAALIVPMVAGLVPIVRGSKLPVVQALSTQVNNQKVKHNFIYRMVTRIRGISRPVMLSLRNTFQRQGRLWLTIGTLTVAGTLFMSVVNVRSSLMQELYDILKMFQFDISLYLDKDYDATTLKNKIMSINGVKMVESRNGFTGQVINSDGSKAEFISVSGLPYNSKMVSPTILSGRWLQASDRNAIVVSSPLAKDDKNLKPGNTITVQFNNKKYQLLVVGIASMAGDKMAFANFDYVAEVKEKPDSTSQVYVIVDSSKKSDLAGMTDSVRTKLKRSGIEVAFFQTIDTILATNENQFNFMVVFLLAMAVMVAGVGGLGLAGTMSLNVMERTREIGVLRSIGATNRAIRSMVMTEGIIIGLTSFILALPLSIPGTIGFNIVLGNAFFERPMTNAYNYFGYVIWLALILIIATLASILPAYRAAKMSIRETLSYE